MDLPERCRRKAVDKTGETCSALQDSVRYALFQPRRKWGVPVRYMGTGMDLALAGEVLLSGFHEEAGCAVAQRTGSKWYL